MERPTEPFSLSVVLPCLNEEQAIPRVIPQLLRTLRDMVDEKTISAYEILVVDDGSTDRSIERLSSYANVRVIKNRPDLHGYGGALKCGFKETQMQWIAFLDMDDTYQPSDLRALAKHPAHGFSGMIVGSRSTLKSGMPLMRAIGNNFYTYLVRLLFGVTVRDVCSGYRLFPRKYLEPILKLSDNGLSFSILLSVWTLKSHVPLIEVPIQYLDRVGKSKLNIISDGFRFLRTILASPGR